MDLDKMMKLLDAGFTKDDILKIINADQSDNNKFSYAPEKQAAEAAPEPAAEVSDAPKEKEPDISALIADAVKKELESFKAEFKVQLNPSLQDIKPLGIDDIIKGFFKED